MTSTPPSPEAATSDGDDNNSNMAAVVALAVLSALLFVVVIVLVVAILRRVPKDSPKANTSCVRSQSFEQNPVNFASKDYKSYLNPAVDAYKPSRRHLQLYNGITLDDATTTQENPFASENSLDHNDVMTPPSLHQSVRSASYAGRRLNVQDLPSHTAAVEAGLYPQRYRLSDVTVESSSDRPSAAGSTLPRNDSAMIQHTAQIEYDNGACVPIEVNTPHHVVSSSNNSAKDAGAFHNPPIDRGGFNPEYLHVPGDGKISPRSSVHSENSYNNGELSSFKVGSTTQLVPNSGSAGAAGPRSLRSLGKGSGNISFIDNSPTNSMYSSVTSQQSAGIGPGSTAGDQHKPGITVYY